MTAEAVLTRCTACRFWQRGQFEGLCRLHAPGAAAHPYDVARWPETRALEGCGEGEPSPPEPGSEKADQTCRACVFWERPGVGIDPTQRGDHHLAWWRDAGFCRRRSPRPGVDIGRHAYWYATHSTDHCFEGRPL